jgi:hypothetical protein
MTNVMNYKTPMDADMCRELRDAVYAAATPEVRRIMDEIAARPDPWEGMTDEEIARWIVGEGCAE